MGTPHAARHGEDLRGKTTGHLSFAIQQVAGELFVEFSSIFDRKRIREGLASNITYNIRRGMQPEQRRKWPWHHIECSGFEIEDAGCLPSTGSIRTRKSSKAPSSWTFPFSNSSCGNGSNFTSPGFSVEYTTLGAMRYLKMQCNASHTVCPSQSHLSVVDA